MPHAEEHFTEEHATDSEEHREELERVSKDERDRARTTLRQAMTDIVNSNKTLVKSIENLTARMNNLDAKEALKAKVSEHPGVVTKDPATGKNELATKEKKVGKVLENADANNNDNSNGAAKEAKLGKTAAFCAIVTALGPYMLNIFQLFRDAMAGKDITSGLLDAADSALIMSLVKKWQAETDQEYWDDFANFYQAHTVAKDVGGAAAGAAPTRPDPTSADLVLILHYSSILNPVPMASGFTWATAKEKADKVDELTKLYTPDIAGKVNFIKSLASIKVRGNTVPRGVQANLGEIAVANTIT
ncbi:hypothetical protein DF3PB_2900002 [uncultured Defluviicoccus sp.]|uniref:Uncharacterized protein n=1 Tax=metagenome TaxID=256318 RepID=A0A380TFP2_9ZZZZ|nr:hypothetical protein DF3PB_2900002 [uncultured Defluviicoccus sp.]